MQPLPRDWLLVWVPPLPRDLLLVWGNRCVTSQCMAELETTTTFITVVSSGENEAWKKIHYFFLWQILKYLFMSVGFQRGCYSEGYRSGSHWRCSTLSDMEWGLLSTASFLCNLLVIVKVFIGYIVLKLNLQDSKALARQRKLSALMDNNFSRRLRLNSGI